MMQTYRNEALMLTLLIFKGQPAHTTHSTKIKHLLGLFLDIISSELSGLLLPMRTIQHQINLVPRSTLPNLLHYRMSPKKNKKLHDIMEDLLKKQLVQPSTSHCMVSTLIVPK